MKKCVLTRGARWQELQASKTTRAGSGLFLTGRLPALIGVMMLDPTNPLTQITSLIIGAAIAVHRELGPGLLESAYQACLEYQLVQQHVKFQRQVTLPLTYHGVHIDCGYRLDLLVEEQIVVEVKSMERLAPIHSAQMITYLKLSKCPVGLILNFNVSSMRQGTRRITNRFLETGQMQCEDIRDLPDCPIG